jgi:hypothetical protein
MGWKNSSGDDVPSGIYFYLLQAGDFIQTRRMLLLNTFLKNHESQVRCKQSFPSNCRWEEMSLPRNAEIGVARKVFFYICTQEDSNTQIRNWELQI